MQQSLRLLPFPVSRFPLQLQVRLTTDLWGMTKIESSDIVSVGSRLLFKYSVIANIFSDLTDWQNSSIPPECRSYQTTLPHMNPLHLLDLLWMTIEVKKCIDENVFFVLCHMSFD